MKMYKLALLGGAAFAVTAASAQADELSDLKAQLASLQSRVAQIETQPAQASNIPAGASLIMFKSGQAFIDSTPIHSADQKRANEGFSIAVTPTADMPAPVAEVTVSGNVRTLLFYNNQDELDFEPSVTGVSQGHSEVNNEDRTEVVNRTRLIVDGKTETAVGEVGGHIRIQGGDPIDGDVTASMNETWGYWQMNDNWRLQAGRWDNTSAVQSGLDWDATVGATGGITNAGVEQIRLIYTNGPITWAVAVEDPQQFTFADGSTIADKSDTVEGASYIQYNGDGVMLMASGVIADDDIGEDTDWFVGAGARFGLGAVAAISLAAGYGDGYDRNTIIALDSADTNYWGVSGLLTFNMNDTTRVELGAGYADASNHADTSVDHAWVVNGGIYWDPVSQLTLGVQADWQEADLNGGKDCGKNGVCGTGGDDFDIDDTLDAFTVRFGTWFRFP